MEYFLLGIVFIFLLRFILAPSHKSELARFKDKGNWTSLGGC